MRVQKSSAASFAQRLVERFKKNTVANSFALVRNVAAECGKSVPDMELQLPFKKSGIMIEGYIPKRSEADLIEAFIKEMTNYGIGFHKLFATDSFPSSGEKQNHFMVFFGGGEDSSCVWISKVLIFHYNRCKREQLKSVI